MSQKNPILSGTFDLQYNKPKVQNKRSAWKNGYLLLFENKISIRFTKKSEVFALDNFEVIKVTEKINDRSYILKLSRVGKKPIFVDLENQNTYEEWEKILKQTISSHKEDELNKPTKSGILRKRGRKTFLRQKWRNRYFELIKEQKKLCYWASEQKKSAQLGTIIFHPNIKIEKTKFIEEPFGILFDLGKRIYEFAANSEKERESWINFFEEAILSSKSTNDDENEKENEKEKEKEKENVNEKEKNDIQKKDIEITNSDEKENDNKNQENEVGVSSEKDEEENNMNNNIAIKNEKNNKEIERKEEVKTSSQTVSQINQKELKNENLQNIQESENEKKRDQLEFVVHRKDSSVTSSDEENILEIDKNKNEIKLDENNKIETVLEEGKGGKEEKGGEKGEEKEKEKEKEKGKEKEKEEEEEEEEGEEKEKKEKNENDNKNENEKDKKNKKDNYQKDQIEIEKMWESIDEETKLLWNQKLEEKILEKNKLFDQKIKKNFKNILQERKTKNENEETINKIFTNAKLYLKELSQYLIDGIPISSLKPNGKLQDVCIWVVGDGTAVCWGDTERTTKINFLNFATMDAILLGITTKIMKKSSSKLQDNLCFSLVSRSGSFDFVTKSESEKELWSSVLDALKHNFTEGYSSFNL
ncbi:tandem ph domain containing protein [Anaeramoeba flamelloides]|uniref:Tandem ph domain containing protein n=1 Tax=Anaeramoeba flamelloides TaxID=1746091 RepID=A0ABQ8YBG8_9EUKA|nr:tandem ph domain containing protein [Anaeramoeba flamelloides]